MDTAPDLGMTVLSNDGRTAVIALEGEIDLYASPNLRRFLERIIAEEIRDIILDLSGAPYIDSAGWQVLTYARSELRRVDGSMTLVGICPDARRVFDILRLGHAFDLAENLAELGVNPSAK